MIFVFCLISVSNTSAKIWFRVSVLLIERIDTSFLFDVCTLHAAYIMMTLLFHIAEQGVMTNIIQNTNFVLLFSQLIKFCVCSSLSINYQHTSVFVMKTKTFWNYLISLLVNWKQTDFIELEIATKLVPG